jgi:rod shape-determining protein MreD/rod shape-determining protein MreC
VSSALAPLQRSVTAITRPIGDFFSGLANLPSLAAENERLRGEVADYQTELATVAELRAQLDYLQGLLGLRATLDPEAVPAVVIANSVSNFEWTVTIDAGTADGIEVGMPVVTGATEGARLIGTVATTTDGTSTVQLIIDPDHKVAGVIGRGRNTGLVVGQGNADMTMESVARVAPELLDEEAPSVFTASYEIAGQVGRYPPNLLIGTVSSTLEGTNQVQTEVTVRRGLLVATVRPRAPVPARWRGAGGLMRRGLAIAVVIATALVLQTTVFHELQLFGVRPELLFLVTIVLALLGGPNEGTVVGFASGLAQDFMMNQPKGITALTLTLLGYVVGMTRQYIVSSSPLVPTAVVFVGTVGGIVFYEVVGFLLGSFDASPGYGLRVALLTGVYNAVLTPIVYPLLRRVTEGPRSRRMARI